ncbi:DUF397 domain-containing protein [Actinocatenispora rupis]|uniref:DUF397 domain-containing protein n=1 Tax=Actinocatenispora rupis TaxID=519421 RepID=UPI001942E451|nr:DUF397 domain-containing protein [Actinocatenispora rupis]
MSTPTQWRTSSRSGSADQNCVEVRSTGDGTIRVRDSKDRRGPVLAVAEASWHAFVGGVRAGSFGEK